MYHSSKNDKENVVDMKRCKENPAMMILFAVVNAFDTW